MSEEQYKFTKQDCIGCREYCELQQENQKLKERWNNFKEFINDNCYYDCDGLSYEELIDEIMRLENINNE